MNYYSRTESVTEADKRMRQTKEQKQTEKKIKLKWQQNASEEKH